MAFADSGESRMPYLGCSLRSLLDKPGMMILLVNSKSPASDAQLKVGDMIMEVDGNSTHCIKDYQLAIADMNERSVEFTIDRKGIELKLSVSFGNKWMRLIY